MSDWRIVDKAGAVVAAFSDDLMITGPLAGRRGLSKTDWLRLLSRDRENLRIMANGK